MKRKILAFIVFIILVVSIILVNVVNAITVQNHIYSLSKSSKKDIVYSLILKKEAIDTFNLEPNLNSIETYPKKYSIRIRFIEDNPDLKIRTDNGESVLNPSLEKGGGYYCLVNEYKHDGNTDISVARKPISSDEWDVGGYFSMDGAENIPDIDYWGSSKKFYATALHSNKDYFYYVEIPDIADEDGWTANILDWSGLDYNFDFYDSTTVGCYEGKKVIYAVIGSTNYPGAECNHAPMILYEKEPGDWTIRWFTGFDVSSHISLDIDQNTGIIYLAFDKGNNIYLLSNDYDDGLDDSWSYWAIEESYDMRYPDVSAGHGVVYMTAQSYCEGDWYPWFYYSTDGETLYYGWLLGEETDESYPRVSLIYDGSHIIGNWIYTKNSNLYSGPSDKVNGEYSVDEHYRCCDVADGLAAWTTPTQDIILTNNIVIGGYTPIAYIDSISPNPAEPEQKVTFKGHGWDSDGYIANHEWSFGDGNMGTGDTTTHTYKGGGEFDIVLTVTDNKGLTGSTAKTLTIVDDNLPPNTPDKPEGPDYVFVEKYCAYDTHSTDPDDDSITYGWDWNGDDQVDEWGNRHEWHAWENPGTYYLKVKAKDKHGALSGWSEPLKIDILEKKTWIIFKPKDASKTNCYTSCGHSDNDEGNFWGSFAGCNEESGSIGGFSWAFDVFSVHSKAYQTIKFHTRSPRVVTITPKIYLTFSELVQMNAHAATYLIYSLNNGDFIDFYEVNGPMDETTWQDILFDIILLMLNLVPGGIGVAISVVSNIVDFGLLLQEMQEYYESGEVDIHEKSFSFTTKDNGNNIISIGARCWAQGGFIPNPNGGGYGTMSNSSFFGQISEIKVDGIAPPTKPRVDGPTQPGRVGCTFTIDLQSLDPHDDEIKYEIDWGDGQQITTGFKPSGEKITVEKFEGYSSESDYTITVYAVNKDGFKSGSTEFQISILNNRAPIKPAINGPNSGKIGNEYTYTFKSTDPDGHLISYYVEWGDGETSNSDDYLTSGTPYTSKHTWDSKKNYVIKAKCVDNLGLESDWATHEIKISRNKNLAFNKLFLDFFQKFPFLFSFFQSFLQGKI